jgi:hypothetical protein
MAVRLLSRLNKLSLMKPFLNALALRSALAEPPLSLWLTWGALAVHGVGVLAIVRLTHQAIWLGLPLIWFAIPISTWLKTGKFNLRMETLTPMILAYGVLGLRLAIAIVARMQGASDGELTVPQPYGNLLKMPAFISLSVAWVWAAQARSLAQASHYTHTGARSFQAISLALVGFTVLWATVTYLDIRAWGVTASDPYAYTQMGYDFATEGTLEHTFPLVETAISADVAFYPLVPVGYRIPDAHTGKSATVWSPGYSVLLAVAYLLLGEGGFYLLTPCLALVMLGVMWFLGQEVLGDWTLEYRWLAGAISVFLLATSLIQLQWLATPMADIASQLFTTLAILLTLKVITPVMRNPNGLPRLDNKENTNKLGNSTPLSITWSGVGGEAWWSFLAGLCLGLAFAVRYTQVLISVPIVVAFTLAYWRSNRRLWGKVMLAAGIGAWLVAAGVLWYHQNAFGHPLMVGSEELKLFSIQWIDDGAWRMLKAAFTQDEFLWVSPFIVCGIIPLWREKRCISLILWLWIIAIVGFHLPYSNIQLRELLSVFPVLALWSGVGVADLVRRLRNASPPLVRSPFDKAKRPSLSRVRIGWIILLLVGFALWQRTNNTLQITSAFFNNFGYLRAEQRDSFEHLEALSPPDAVIAASLHSGAIILYSERESVRPYDWEDEEWLRFIEALGNRSVYLLVDGIDMEAIASTTQQHYTLELVAELDLPYFYPGGGSVNQRVNLYALHKR